jgi:transcription elongation factor Elf1
MARKKTKAIKIKRLAKPKLDRTFSCPFCSQERAVDCKIDKSRLSGSARCRQCGAGYQTVVNSLTDPIDIYAEWIDAIDARQKAKKKRIIEKEVDEE